MDVILFGSPLNPLSAVAANYFKDKRNLKLIVLPKGMPIDISGGFTYFCSQVCVAAFRYFQVLLRMSGMKRDGHYSCLLEFVKDNPFISIIYCQRGDIDLEQRICSAVSEEEIGEHIIFSCIFPFKIPVGFKKFKHLINMHPGMLPENRGPNPYFWALAMQKKTTGITFHVLTDKMDEGPVLFQKTFDIDAVFSEYGLEKLSADLLKKSLPVFFDSLGEFCANPSPQVEGTYHKTPGRDDRRRYRRYSLFKLRDFLNRQVTENV